MSLIDLKYTFEEYTECTGIARRFLVMTDWILVEEPMLGKYQIYIDNRLRCTVWALDIDDARIKVSRESGIELSRVDAVELIPPSQENS